MQPIVIVPWQENFIAALADLLVRQHGADLARVAVVFPHRRPRRYLLDQLRQHPDLPKPFLVPDIMAQSDLFHRLHRDLAPHPVKPLARLDQIELLYQITAALQPHPQGLLHRLPLNRATFFPWGRRLADLMERLFRHQRTPANLSHLQGEVMDMAAALLEQLGAIYQSYTEQLEDHHWTTPGYDAHWVAHHLDAVLPQLSGWTFYLAGFYALTRTQEVLYRHLWQHRQAVVVWHTDPNLGSAASGHWSCSLHQEWLRRWQAPAQVLPLSHPPKQPALKFYEGYDLHSQLSVLPREVDAAGASVAVVLPQPDLVMPVLHHLPLKGVNISLGYPLVRSSLYGLLHLILELYTSRDTAGRYYWRHLLKLIRHPYLKMLSINDSQPLRQVFPAWEEDIRQGSLYVDPASWQPPPELFPDGPQAEAVRSLLDAVRHICLFQWTTIVTLADLAQALNALGTLLLQFGQHLWPRFPLDAECLHRLLHHIAPSLAATLMSREPLPPDVWVRILREYCQDERVPFEADPITGTQILGMLETRLLNFEKVIFFNAIESQLPGPPPYNPLIPDSLQHLLGLPDVLDRDRVAAYNFYRLLQGAQEAILLYQHSLPVGDLLEAKTTRSRFLEQLIWEQEQALGRLLSPGQPPLHKISFPLPSLTLSPQPLPKTPALQARLRQWLTSRPVPVSALEAYLTCPVRFFYEHVLHLAPPAEVQEDPDLGRLGQLIHDVLRQFFAPRRGIPFHYADCDPQTLVDLYLRRLRDLDFFQHQRLDVRLALEMTGAARLRALLHHPVATTLIDLEKPVQARLSLDNATVTLTGRLDRVDRRPDGELILDYKIGALPKVAGSAWEGASWWDILLTEPAAALADPHFFPELAAGLPGLQLPAYLYLYWRATGVLPHNALWVELAAAGAEKPFFPNTMDLTQRRRLITAYVPALLSFLLHHILQAPSLPALEGRQCRWCPYHSGCRQSPPLNSSLPPPPLRDSTPSV